MFLQTVLNDDLAEEKKTGTTTSTPQQYTVRPFVQRRMFVTMH